MEQREKKVPEQLIAKFFKLLPRQRGTRHLRLFLVLSIDDKCRNTGRMKELSLLFMKESHE